MKMITRLFLIVLTVFLLFAFVSVSASVETVYGDMNGDGKFDSLDVVYMSRALANWPGYSMTGLQKTLADIDLNGSFQAIDAIIASRSLAGWNGYETLPIVPEGTLPFRKGININGFESFSTNDYDSVPSTISVLTSEDTYKNIKSQGFDHVRLAVNLWRAYLDESDNYTTEQFMWYVDTAINYALNNGLYVTLDFHGWFEIGDESNDYDECLYVWDKVAERYKDYDKKLSFELLNEPWYENSRPRPYLSDSKLNDLQADLISIIRKKGSNNATRLIICCTADGNKAWKLSELKLPKDDNLAVAIHEYQPYNFTHQNFSWAGLSGQTTTLAAQGGFKSATSWDFGQITSFMKKTGIPVVLNEFGLNLVKASSEDVSTSIKGVTSFCEANNIPWAYWQYYDSGYSREGSMSLYRKNSYFGSWAWDQTALDAMFD